MAFRKIFAVFSALTLSEALFALPAQAEPTSNPGLESLGSLLVSLLYDFPTAALVVAMGLNLVLRVTNGLLDDIPKNFVVRMVGVFTVIACACGAWIGWQFTELSHLREINGERKGGGLHTQTIRGLATLIFFIAFAQSLYSAVKERSYEE